MDKGGNKTMKKYNITINGCDDSTEIEMVLTREGFAAVMELARVSHINSRYGCMPTINIEGYDIDRQGVVTVDNGEEANARQR